MGHRSGIRIVVVIYLILFVPPIFPVKCEALESGVKTLTIKDAITIALLNNRSIQELEQQVEFARAGILYAKSRFLPQVGTSYTYTYSGAVLSTVSTPSKKKDDLIFLGYQSDNYLNFSVKESVYNGGADIALLAETRIGLKIQQEKLRATRLDVEFETKRLFYGLLLAYETKRIAQDLIDQARAHYEETAEMYGQGTASKFDVLQSKVQVSRLLPQLINAENAIEIIKAEFKKLLVLDMREPVEVKGELRYRDVGIDSDAFLRESYQRNPQMMLKLLGMDMEKWAIEYAKSGWYPDISAAANYYYRSNFAGDMLNSYHSNWDVGVKASIAIFDGFATKARVDAAKARYEESRIKKDDVVDQLAVDITTACLDLVKAKAVIDAESDSISEAKESLRLANIRFENGVGINLDILDAQVALAQVQQSLAQGIYDYIMAKSQLDRTMGREFSTEESYYARP